MRSISEKELVDALRQAYNLGSECCKAVNFGRGWSSAKTKRERRNLDKLLARLGAAPLSDDEYAPFCR